MSFDLDQEVHQCTRGNSILGFVFLSHSITLSGYECSVVRGLSHHSAVYVTLNIRVLHVNPDIVSFLDFTRADVLMNLLP